MKDFIMSALPFVITGVCVIIICINNKKDQKTYLTEGLVVGMALGIAIASATKIDMGLGTSLGLLIGEAAGACLKKKDKN